MLSTTWAGKCPRVMLQSWAWGGKDPAPSLRELLFSPQPQFQAKDPRHICRCPSWAETHIKNSPLYFPSALLYTFVPPAPHFKPIPSQTHHEPSFPPAAPDRIFSYRPMLRARACWIPLISFCVCSIFSIVWKRRTLRAFLVLLLAW